MISLTGNHKKAIFGILALLAIALVTLFFSTLSSNGSKNTSLVGDNAKNGAETRESNSSSNSKKIYKLSCVSGRCGSSQNPVFKDGEKNYAIVTHEDTLKVIDDYKTRLSRDFTLAGKNLHASLKKLYNVVDSKGITKLKRTEFIDAILASKDVSAGAAGSTFGPNHSWSRPDVQILADLNVVVPLKIFDNGQWTQPHVHDKSFDGYLLFTPGALLENTNNDYDEVVVKGKINIEAYSKLYERRLLPLLIFANNEAAAKGKKAIVTVPGLGCSIFAGSFSADIHDKFDQALRYILKQNSSLLKHIDLVYYGRVDNGTSILRKYDNGLKYRMCFAKSTEYRNQLDKPVNFKIDPEEDYSNHILFSMVAWSPICLPGNTFFGGNRGTDDGVKAAATSTMSSLFPDIEANYNSNKFKYLPDKFQNWTDIPSLSDFHLNQKGGLLVLEEVKE